jgi:hypothetical protein
MKYTLDEIKEMLLDPSFDIMSRKPDVMTPQGFVELVDDAVKYHEELSNDNNAENQ